MVHSSVLCAIAKAPGSRAAVDRQGVQLKQLFDLSGRTALVTGGSRGLGLAMAAALGEMGAKLAITARKPEELAAAAEVLTGQGCEVFSTVSDLSRVATIKPMIDAAIAALGPIDVVVNNAGTSWGAPAEDYPLEGWRKVIDLNLTGTWLVTQEVGRSSMLPRRSGRIINIASVAGLKGSSHHADERTAKAGRNRASPRGRCDTARHCRAVPL
jgi:gluconate 5-dehydrogenase